MGRRSRGKGGGGGQQRHVKGFRPGKAPPELKKRQARQRLGKDASWAQKQMVDAMAGQGPEKLRRSLRRWALGLLVAAVVAGVGGLFVYRWTILGGVAVHLLGAVLVFLWFRLRRQEKQLMEMAKILE